MGPTRAPKPERRPLLRLVIAGLACGAAARAVEPPAEPARVALGAQTHFAQTWTPDLTPRIVEAGVTHVRDELYWQEVEPAAGVFRFPPRYDAYMAALRRAGVAPLIELNFENVHHDDGQTPHTEAGFAAYARYAVEVLRRYGDQIEAVEIWNEYNGTFAKGPATADRSGTYAKMLRVAYAAIKRERPDVIVVGGATAGLPMPYLERLFEAGALDSMDAVSVHPYRSDSTPEGLETQVAALRALIARHNGGREKPVWVTEIGWSLRDTGIPGDLVIDEAAQARFLVRAFALLFAGGAERVYWYLFRDYGVFATMGLVEKGEGYPPKPAHRAMAELARRLSGTRYAGRAPTPADLYALSFARDGDAGPVHVLWSLKPRTIMLPEGARARDLSGEPLAPGPMTLDDSPIYVEGELPELPAGGADHELVLAESVSGFSPEQGRNGWTYGVLAGEPAEFRPLGGFRVTDWREEWTGAYPYISITATDQHPALVAGRPVPAVRRWSAPEPAVVAVAGVFQASGRGGDGVEVSIRHGDTDVFFRELGAGRTSLARFELELALKAGEHVDFVVGPGAGAAFDATRLNVTIRRIEEPRSR